MLMICQGLFRSRPKSCIALGALRGLQESDGRELEEHAR